MFKKKSCGRCGKSLKSSYDFCPYCGNMLDKREEDLGMLGKDDSLNGLENFKMPLGFGSLFNFFMKNIEKQLREPEKKSPPKNSSGKGNISISISTFGGMPPHISIDSPAGKKKREDVRKLFFNKHLSKENLEKFSKLPRQEPKTSLRRVDNRIVYEIELPGVRSMKDISILNLESSMELKAVSDKKSYAKLIPMNFPILDFNLHKDKLVLEMDAEGK